MLALQESLGYSDLDMVRHYAIFVDADNLDYTVASPMARRYNQEGASALMDRRHQHPGGRLLQTPAQQAKGLT